MAKIRSTDDLLKALRENVEWREAVRRELLTEDLLGVPKIVGKFAESLNVTNVKVESLIDHQAAMQSNLNDLIQMVASGLGSMQNGFIEMRNGFGITNQRLDQVDQRLDQVDQRLDQVDQRLDNMDAKIEGMDTKFTAKLDQTNAEIRDIKRHFEN